MNPSLPFAPALVGLLFAANAAFGGNAEALIRSSQIKSGKGDWSGAMADLNKAIKAYPEDAIAYNARGCLKFRATLSSNLISQTNGISIIRTNELADFTKAIELKPDLFQARFNRAFVEQSIFDSDGAMADYSKIIELKPDSSWLSQAYTERGILRTGWHDFNGALMDVNEAVKLCPSNSIACKAQSLLLVNFDSGDVKVSRVQTSP